MHDTSERCVRLSPHTAQAATNALFTGRGFEAYTSKPSRYYTEDNTRSNELAVTE